MLTETKRTDLFCEYYAKWITVYKKGAIRKVTMDKYLMTQKWPSSFCVIQSDAIRRTETR